MIQHLPARRSRLLPACLLIGTLLGCSPKETEAPPANILWITLDTLRADHLGCYGYFRNTTPRIDAFAKESVLFEDCVVPMATTLPSHLSMLTSTWPIEHGVLANVTQGGKRFVRSTGLVSFAEVVSEAGYATAGFISAKPLQSWTGIDAGFQTYDGPEQKERIAQETVDKALAWLDQHQGQSSDQPFFLWVHLFDPHAPFQPPAEFKNAFQPQPELDTFLADRGIPDLVQGPNGLDVETRPSHDLYDAEILYTDSQVGRLFDRLDQGGLKEHTAVLLMSDHGEGLGQHGVARHGLIWNELVNSVFILRAPGLAPARFQAPVSSIDAFPTLLGLLDIPGARSFLAQSSGHDLFAPEFKERPQWSQSSARLISYGLPVLYSLRRGPWKFVWNTEESTGVLYNLTEDPFESTDVSEQNLLMKVELQAELLASKQIQEQRGQVFGSGGEDAMDPKTLQDLRDLGYTGND